MDTEQQQSHQRADLSPLAAQTGSLSSESLERCTGLARAITAHCIQQERQQRSDLACYHHDKAIIILYIIIILEI